ncbi:hypothetical protein ACHAWF_010274 [Thalassiosira exigua]
MDERSPLTSNHTGDGNGAGGANWSNGAERAGRHRHLQLSGPSRSRGDVDDAEAGRGDDDDAGRTPRGEDDGLASTLASVAGNVLEVREPGDRVPLAPGPRLDDGTAGRFRFVLLTRRSVPPPFSSSPPPPSRQWYDFAIYGYFADIIGRKFFPPSDDEATSIVEVFLVFGGAFLVRPVGGVLMGYVGDTWSRKRALELSIFLMAGPTFLMGCLPTFEVWGWWAVASLVSVRLMQGLSAGGQLMSSLVFVAEGHDPRWWGWYGSVSSVARLCYDGGECRYAPRGGLRGELDGLSQTLSWMKPLSMGRSRNPVWNALLFHTGSALSWILATPLSVWGLRSVSPFPFLLACLEILTIFFSLSGIYLKHNVKDHEKIVPSGSGRPVVGERKPTPLELALSTQLRGSLLSVTASVILWSGGFYLIFVWLVICMEDLLEKPIENAFAINAWSLFVTMVLIFPFAGWLSDIYGRKPVMTVGATGIAFCSPLAMNLLSSGTVTSALFAQTVLGMFLCLYGAPLCAFLVEHFPPETRLTSVAIGYNTAMAIAGGMSPSLATWLVTEYGPVGAGWLLSTFATISLCGVYMTPKHAYSH